jgi:hypothetical protein
MNHPPDLTSCGAGPPSPAWSGSGLGLLCVLAAMVCWIGWLAAVNVRAASLLSERYALARQLAQAQTAPDGTAKACRSGTALAACWGQLDATLAALPVTQAASGLLAARCDRSLQRTPGALVIERAAREPAQGSRTAQEQSSALLASGDRLQLSVCGPGFHVVPVATLAVP